MRLTLALFAALLLGGCSNDPISMDEPAPIKTTACSAGGTSVSVEPVRGGDVNTLFVKAIAKDSSGRPLTEGLSFFLTSPKAGYRQGLEAPLPEKDGTATLDVGGSVATSEDVRDEVKTATRLIVEYGGRSATANRSQLCPSNTEVDFAPAVRDYHPVATGASTPAQLIQRLDAVAKALLRNHGPYQLPDGSSPCRLMRALVDQLDAQPTWFDKATAKDASDRLHEALFGCPDAPMLTGMSVDTAADSLAGR